MISVSIGRWFMDALNWMPQKALSRFVLRPAMKVRSPFLVKTYAQFYAVNLKEAERDLSHYTSVADFFTRKLAPDARPLDTQGDALLSPCDGQLSNQGEVGEGHLFQAKGRAYELDDLVASGQALNTFKDGHYYTIYLAPKDYHRVHSPADGRITGYSYVPGRLFPVNQTAVENVDKLFAKNERLVTHLETEKFGRMDLVMVGAFGVGRIRASYDPSVVTNIGRNRVIRFTYPNPLPISRGQELGVFEMGSTVILIVERALRAGMQLRQNGVVRMGMALGTAIVLQSGHRPGHSYQKHP